MLQNPLVAMLLQMLFALFLMHWLRSLSIWLFIVLTLLVGTAALTNFLLRYHNRRLCPVYKHPLGRWWIDLICRGAKEQPPISLRRSAAAGNGARTESSVSSKQGSVSPSGPKEPDGLRVQDTHDFRLLRENLKDDIRGFDFGIDTAISRIEQNLRMRTDRTNLVSNPPLATFLLAGPEGVGKRHFARKIADELFHPAIFTNINVREYTDDSSAIDALFGTPHASGALTAAVRQKPYHVLLLEHIDAAGERLRDRLRELFLEGYVRELSTGTLIKYENCVFVVTTTAAQTALMALEADPRVRSSYNRLASQAIASSTSMDEPFLAQIHEILLFSEPTRLVKAEVVVLLAELECDLHRLRLEYINPRIIAEEVAAINREYGYAPLRSRVRSRIRDAIDGARQAHARSVSIT